MLGLMYQYQLLKLGMRSVPTTLHKRVGEGGRRGVWLLHGQPTVSITGAQNRALNLLNPELEDEGGQYVVCKFL